MSRSYRTCLLFLCGLVAGLVINSMIGDIVTRNLVEPYQLHRNENTTGYQTLHNGADVTDDIIANELSKKVRILCWIMTAPQFLQTKARHVRATWGRRCNVLLFASDYENRNFSTIDIHVQPGRDHLTAKSMQTFDYVYKHHLDDADWFLKADDDTYVIMENLRYLLMNLNSSAALALGRVWVRKQYSYFSGGAGYVMSKEMLRRFGQRSPNLCEDDLGDEDIKVSACMVRLGVKFVESRDRFLRSRFNAYDIPFYNTYSLNIRYMGIKLLSDLAVSFHYVKPDRMYEFEYFLYRLRPYGIVRGDRPQLNIPIPPPTRKPTPPPTRKPTPPPSSRQTPPPSSRQTPPPTRKPTPPPSNRQTPPPSNRQTPPPTRKPTPPPSSRQTPSPSSRQTPHPSSNTRAKASGHE